MDVKVFDATIADITEIRKSLPTRGDHQLKTLSNLLEEIQELLSKAKEGLESPAALPFLWQLDDVLNGLKEDPPSSYARPSFFPEIKKKILLQILIPTGHSDRLNDRIEEIKELKEVARKALNEKTKLANWEKRVELVGREKEKKEIIEQLSLHREKIGEDVHVPVVAIVGIAGIGKTKLAELVCGDKQVKDHVGPIWVPRRIHETFDVEAIAKHVITESAAPDRKCYLLVLDDLRASISEERLKALRDKLMEARLFVGAILITTRSFLVAKVDANASTVVPCVLQGLNEEETLSLFKQFPNEGASNLRNSIQDIGKDIVAKCRGVPLAIITMARLRTSRGSHLAEAEVAVSKEEFLQELVSIYFDELSMLHIRCFAYCSLFPQDYLIEADRLIRLWMGEEFLTTSEPEETGLKCFNFFLERSIFQDMKEDEFGVVRNCRMHPLMHDLASFVARDVNITMDPKGQNVRRKVLRASFDFSLDVSCGIPDSLFQEAKKLRTIILPAKTQSLLPHEVKMSTSTCDEIFTTFKSLRVLDLHDLGMKMVPSSIGELKSLRYLDLSQNNIEKLPSSITKLSRLQTLKLSQCHNLKELPKDFEDLSSLRHLDIEGCTDLTHMPRGINKLSSLQTLSLFVASKNYPMGGLGELTGLNNLTGNLEILHLERLNASPLNTKDAYLEKKQHLQRLTLRWDDDEEKKENEGGSHQKSLECLKPNPNLGVLFIVGYKGHTLSNWLYSIKSLVKFNFYNCPRCQFLPPLDQLTSLKILELQSLDSLKFIAENSDTDHHGRSSNIEGSSSSISINTPTQLFPSLKELTISDCPNLRSWWKMEKKEHERPFFTRISKLQVQHCPKLTCMPLYPGLDEKLVLVGSSVKPLWDTINYGTKESFVPLSKLKSMVIASVEEVLAPPEKWLTNFTSLEHFHIQDCRHLESLPQGMNHLSSLQCLTIENCPILDQEYSRDEWKGLKNLRSLNIREIPKLESLRWGVENVTSLQELGLHGCTGLTSLPERIGDLTSLGRLVISECSSLKSLPKGIKKLGSLHTLIIMGCPLLLPRCQHDTGDDWPQIAHVKNILVK